MRDRKQQRVSHCGVGLEGLGPRALNGLGKASPPFPHRAWGGLSSPGRQSRRPPASQLPFRGSRWAAQAQRRRLPSPLVFAGGEQVPWAPEHTGGTGRRGSSSPRWPGAQVRTSARGLGRTRAARSWRPIPIPGRTRLPDARRAGRGSKSRLQPDERFYESCPDAEAVASIPSYQKCTRHPHQCVSVLPGAHCKVAQRPGLVLVYVSPSRRVALGKGHLSLGCSALACHQNGWLGCCPLS